MTREELKLLEWEKEEWFNSTNSQELLANAVAELARLDEENNINKIIWVKNVKKQEM